MPLRDLIEKATEKAGSQVALAELMGVKQQDVSAWKTGRRVCTAQSRIELCEIADYDLKVALIEQVIEGLDQSVKAQADAAKMLQAVVDAFPNEGWRKRWES
ncbi:YdaS family helix-turn-helix protein [Comamonas odontotermitis]|uniref:YdaS family helix-turn-helix protein n=1 Tax=Comamonas odontotermitis TaxID=379895 RepID=UPI00366DAC81